MLAAIFDDNHGLSITMVGVGSCSMNLGQYFCRTNKFWATGAICRTFSMALCCVIMSTNMR